MYRIRNAGLIYPFVISILWIISFYQVATTGNIANGAVLIVISIGTIVAFRQTIISNRIFKDATDKFSNFLGQVIADFLAFLMFYLKKNSLESISTYRLILGLILSFDFKRKHESVFFSTSGTVDLADLEFMSTIHYRCFAVDKSSMLLNPQNLPKNLSNISLDDFWAFLYKAVSCPRLNPNEKDQTIQILLKQQGLYTIEDFEDKNYRLKNKNTKEEMVIPMKTIPPDLLKLIEYAKLHELENSSYSNVLDLVQNDL